MRLLVVEENLNIDKVLSKKLKYEGYTIDNCSNIDDILFSIKDTEYDAIIIDTLLPNLNGTFIVSLIRNKGYNTPIILLSSDCDTKDKVTALDSGANDFLVRPFAFEELLARIRCVTRSANTAACNILKVSDLILNRTSKTVMRNNTIIYLTSKEFAILEYLMINQGQVLSKEKIQNHIWNYDFQGDSDIVKVYIRYIRKKIDDKSDIKLINTIRNFGYVIKI